VAVAAAFLFVLRLFGAVLDAAFVQVGHVSSL
jgi:hypothetical protein